MRYIGRSQLTLAVVVDGDFLSGAFGFDPVVENDDRGLILLLRGQILLQLLLLLLVKDL